MKKLIILTLTLITNYTYADSDVTNSNNNQTATNYIDDHRIEQTYDNRVDNSMSHDASTHIDDSINNTYHKNSDNIKDSYNQANQQTTTNINTEGDLQDSKNTNSYNTDSHNTDTSGSNNDLRSDSNSGENTLSNQQGQDQSQGQTQTTGPTNMSSSTILRTGTTNVKTGSTLVRVAAPQVTTGSVNVNNNNVKQHRIVPLAYSPSMGMSVSQDNCSNGASVGVTTGIFGISGGVPIGSDDCNRRKDVAMWMSLQQDSIACQRMIQSEENLEAMRKANLTCEMLIAAGKNNYIPMQSNLNVPANSYWEKQERLVDKQLNAIFNNNLQNR